MAGKFHSQEVDKFALPNIYIYLSMTVSWASSVYITTEVTCIPKILKVSSTDKLKQMGCSFHNLFWE